MGTGFLAFGGSAVSRRGAHAAVDDVVDQVAVSKRPAAELPGFPVRWLLAWDARRLGGPSTKR